VGIRLLLLAILFAALLMIQRMAMAKTGWREKMVYAFLLAYSVYEGIDYAGHFNWTELYEWNDLLFGDAARSIERYLSYKPK
jgi:hypothetical protein